MSSIKDIVINHCLSDVYALPTSVETVLNRKPDVKSNKFHRFNASSDKFIFFRFFYRFFLKKLKGCAALFQESSALHSALFSNLRRRCSRKNFFSLFLVE